MQVRIKSGKPEYEGRVGELVQVVPVTQMVRDLKAGGATVPMQTFMMVIALEGEFVLAPLGDCAPVGVAVAI